MNKKIIEIKEIDSIYKCLTDKFWTKRKCRDCQQIFTQKDYQENNYAFSFWEIGNIYDFEKYAENLLQDIALLNGVIVRLLHLNCSQ